MSSREYARRGRGYWAKKAHGHPVAQEPLPKLLEVPRIVRHQRPAVPATEPGSPPNPEFPVEEEDKVEIERINQLLSAGAFLVKKPRKALRHPLVVAARDVLRRGIVSKEIVHAPWNEPCLDVRVSKPRVRRALAIMAAIVAVLEHDGVKITVTPADRSYGERSDDTSATIFGEKIRFGITEHIRQVRVPDPTAPRDSARRQRTVRRYEPLGELSICIFSNSSYFTTIWHDTEQTKIESAVPECVASMMKIAVEYRRNTAKRHQEELFRRLR